jgi:hypothetical protein
MEMGTDVGHGVYSAVPAGLWQFRIFPAVKTAGYCRDVPLGQSTAQIFRPRR